MISYGFIAYARDMGSLYTRSRLVRFRIDSDHIKRAVSNETVGNFIKIQPFLNSLRGFVMLPLRLF